MPKPIPVPDELSQPFWDAVNEKRLLVQNCTTPTCNNRKQYPPRRTCAECGLADNLQWYEVKGRGHILGYCVMYDSRLTPLHADQPLNIVYITLDEDPEIKFLSSLPGRKPGDVPVGGAVETNFVPVSETQLIHEWKVVE